MGQSLGAHIEFLHFLRHKRLCLGNKAFSGLGLFFNKSDHSGFSADQIAESLILAENLIHIGNLLGGLGFREN